MLAVRCTRIRRNELQWRRIGRRGNHDRRVRHRTLLFELRADVRDGRCLLADGNVNAIDRIDTASLGLFGVRVLLIDDRVDRNGGLTRLAIADDELALPAADRDHAIDGLDTGLQWLLNRLTLHDAQRLALERQELIALDLRTAIDRNTEWID